MVSCLAQGGSWVCLDEFNRIDIEVLSVIAQQLLVLCEGRMAKKSNINFMGIQISLLDHHVIITVNHGYALRGGIRRYQEPVALCKLYILCSEQLSQQSH